MESFFRDLKYSLRLLIKKPLIAVIVVSVLTLVIGANTAIFSFVDTILLRPLPFPNADNLVMVWENNPELQQVTDRVPTSAANLRDWKEQNHSFTDLAAFWTKVLYLTGANEPERVEGVRVTGNFFSLLGVNAALGRTFVPEDDRPDARMVVIGHGLWQRRFGGDPSVVGRPAMLDGEPYTVIGVMPKDFDFPKRSDLPPSFSAFPVRSELWIPLGLKDSDIQKRGKRNLVVFGRLRPGVTVAQGQSDMQNIAQSLQQQYPQANKGWTTHVVGMQEQIVSYIRPALLLLFMAVVFMLLIGCANVLNLQMAHGIARRRELALRSALGASRMRLIQQILTENLVLFLISGVLGFVVAIVLTKLLLIISPADIPRLDEIKPDLRLFGFTLITTLGTAVAAGIITALKVSKINLDTVFKDTTRGAAGSRAQGRARSVLVAAEIALSLMLLIGAGLLIKSFLRLQSVDPGFEAKNVLTAEINLPPYKYSPEQQATIFQQIVGRVAGAPGVQAAGAVTNLPMSGAGESTKFTFEHRQNVSGEEQPLINYAAVSGDYFRALGIPLLQGRAFTEADNDKAPRVAIVNEALARRFWANQDPIGKRLERSKSEDDVWYSIIGVVNDVRHSGLDKEPVPEVYFSYLQESSSFMVLVAQTATRADSFAGTLRREVQAVDKDQPLSNVKTMEQLMTESKAGRNFNTLLMTGCAVIALILAAAGIYGVVSYTVTQRTREIGIRMALGAPQDRILKNVIMDGLKLALFGLVPGLILAFAVTRIMSSLLYEVSVTDPVVFIAASLVLLAVALVASFLPARRATRVDPVTAIVHE
jgi:putative ABC transport system permease protein